MATPEIMIRRCEGLLGTPQITEQQSEFIEKLSGQLHAGQVVRLSQPQLDFLRDIHDSHFAG